MAVPLEIEQAAQQRGDETGIPQTGAAGIEAGPGNAAFGEFMNTSGRLSGQAAGGSSSSAGSSPARSIDKKRMAALDRKCEKLKARLHWTWRNEWRAWEKQFATADAKRKALRHKMRRGVANG